MTMKMLPSSSSRTSVLSWRRRLLASVLSPILAVGFLLAPVHAQTSTSSVPGLFNFQGKVANANGTLVGAGTPVNKTVIFRIWDHATNSTTGNLVYSEQQNVTITDGEFSVLIGQGSAVTTAPLGYSEDGKGPSATTIASASVFGGSTRYLGITIDDGNSATTDPEITPRQQLVTSAYAFRAKYAESVGSNGTSVLTVLDSGNVGIGAANPAAKLDVAGNVRAGGVANASFVLANADNNAVGTVGTASSVGSLSTDAAVNDVVVRASAGKLLLQTGAGASAISIDSNNRVGIGTTAPNAALDVNGALMLKGALTGASGRPAVGTGRVAAEISGYGSVGAFNDDGFLRLSAGGGTTANAKSFIDLSGYSTVADMDRNLVFGTTNVERLRITNSGALLLKNALTNSSPRPAVAASRLAAEIAGYGSGGSANDDGFLRLSAGGGTNANSKSYIDFSGFSTAADMDRNLVFGTAGAERMRINVFGNVGIGTSNPLVALDVANGPIRVSTGYGVAPVPSNNVTIGGLGTSPNAGSIAWGDGSGWKLNFGTMLSGTFTPRVTFTDGGRVGITNSSPAAPLHVSNWAAVDTYEEARGDGSGFYDRANIFTGGLPLGAIVDSGVRAAHFIVNSDARIKKVQGRSDGAADLATLLQIQITDYTYRDTRTHGGKMHKKVIAQQVEQVLPQAVNKGTGVLPDIRVKASIDGGWIIADTDLKVGERVQLIGGEGSAVCEVLEVQPGRFRAAFESKTNNVFVYGREVSDFRSVDYEAIAMLNVSATQELARENSELKKRVAELEAKDRSRDAKLAAIEKLLTSSSTVMALPAKPATANGQD